MAKKSRTRAARERRQKQQRQNQRRLLLVGIVIIAVVVVALLIVSTQPTEAFIPQNLDAKYDNIQRSSSIEGYPRLGDPDAPVTVTEYASFSCPGCEAFHDASFNAILDRVRTGQVLFTYVPLQTGSIPNAEGSARAALCAGQQGQFWEMHDLLFDWHTRYANTAYSQSRLLAGVEGLGMSADSFNSCFFSEPITETLENAQLEGVSRTPTVEVNGATVQSEQTGGIPTTQEVLRAIDNATPSDWSPTANTEPESAEDTGEEDASEDVDAQSAEDEETESDVDEPTESDMDESTDNDEPTESDVEESTDGDEPTESDTEETTGGDEPTESDVEESANGNEPTESDTTETSGD